MINTLISTYCHIDDFYIIYEKEQKRKLIGNTDVKQTYQLVK